jgi:hypothetical protein
MLSALATAFAGARLDFTAATGQFPPPPGECAAA